jgi:hypothetical protein
MMKHGLCVALGLLGAWFPAVAQQAYHPGKTADQPVTLEQLQSTRAFDPALALSLYQPRIFSAADSSLLFHKGPVTTWSDGGRLASETVLTEIGMGQIDLFPVMLLSAAPAPAKKANTGWAHRLDGKNLGPDGKDSPDEMMSSSSNQIYYGGEVGVLYGQWSGKGGGDILQTYILGTVGNDKFQITAGASYEESSGRGLRFRSFPAPR